MTEGTAVEIYTSVVPAIWETDVGLLEFRSSRTTWAVY